MECDPEELCVDTRDVREECKNIISFIKWKEKPGWMTEENLKLLRIDKQMRRWDSDCNFSATITKWQKEQLQYKCKETQDNNKRGERRYFFWGVPRNQREI